MSDVRGLSINTTDLTEAARRLDDLADRLDAVLRAEGPLLSPAAVGRDEVSARAAATLGEVQASYVESSAKGIAELREIAATLRSGAIDVADADAGFTV